MVNNTGPSSATSTSPPSPKSNSSQHGTSTTTHGAGFNAVTKELETLTRSASFARECERLAAVRNLPSLVIVLWLTRYSLLPSLFSFVIQEFVSCAKVTQIRTKDEQELAQETLVSLAQVRAFFVAMMGRINN